MGESISQTVTITPGEGEVFKILKVNALKGSYYKQSLKEIEIDGKMAYELTVENTREIEGRYFDKIFMITDRSDQKPISIIVSGYIKKPKDPNPEAKDTEAIPENKPESAAQ